MQFLLSKGADKHLKNADGFNALHCAADSCFYEGCKVLLAIEDKTFLNSRTNKNETALDIVSFKSDINPN